MKQKFRLELGKPEPMNSNTGRHQISFKGSKVIDLWFGDLFAIKTAEEAEEMAKILLQTLNQMEKI
jgi:hypothetical protein